MENYCKYESLTKQEIRDVLKDTRECYLAVSDNNQPYAVPMYYKYEGDCYEDVFKLYNCKSGMKTSCINANDKVCISVMLKCNGRCYTVIAFGVASMYTCSGGDIIIKVKVTSMTGRVMELKSCECYD